MKKCIICGTEFEPSKNYMSRVTCSDECLKIHMRNLTPEIFLQTSFKKGNIPFNKGVPQVEWMSESSIEKCKQTYINHQKKCMSVFSTEEGRYLPHNTLKKGTITKRVTTHNKGKNKGKTEINYYINIDWKGNRKPNNLYKRYIWEVYHQQDIPKGYVVYSLDGNAENFAEDNLVLISRGDLARINKGNLKL